MLTGSARKAGIMSANEPSTPSSSTSLVDGARYLVEKFPSSAAIGPEDDYIEHRWRMWILRGKKLKP